jgi:hypothetical protein
LPLSTYTYLRGTNGNDLVDFSVALAPGAMFAAGDGNDTLIGSAFDDRFNGGTGNDSLTGGAGHDALTDGTGQDILVGGDRSFSPAGMTNAAILDRLGGGGDAYILVNDGGFQDVIFGFDGIGGWHAGPQDFLWLKGYAAGSALVFEQYLGSALGGYTTATIWESTQYYKVKDALGNVEDYVILQSYAETQAEADRTLGAGDYNWMA